MSLSFYYASMNSGKSTMLLQTNYNYIKSGMKTLVFIPEIIGTNKIVSRIGLSTNAIVFNKEYNFYKEIYEGTLDSCIHCIMIDECQFLTKEQVVHLCQIVDYLEFPVLCYGIRSDFKGEPFDGSKYLLTLADKLIELKSVCSCGKKAIMNRRLSDVENQIDIGHDKYESMCRACFSSY